MAHKLHRKWILWYELRRLCEVERWSSTLLFHKEGNPSIWNVVENVSSRIRRIKQKQTRGTEHKMQNNVNTAPSKPHYIYNQQKNICMINTFLKSLSNTRDTVPIGYREPWTDKPCSLTPKPVALERYTMWRSASIPEISTYRFERSRVLILMLKHISILCEKMQE